MPVICSTSSDAGGGPGHPGSLLRGSRGWGRAAARRCLWEAEPGGLRGAARRNALGKCKPRCDPPAAGRWERGNVSIKHQFFIGRESTGVFSKLFSYRRWHAASLTVFLLLFHLSSLLLKIKKIFSECSVDADVYHAFFERVCSAIQALVSESTCSSSPQENLV